MTKHISLTSLIIYYFFPYKYCFRNFIWLIYCFTPVRSIFLMRSWKYLDALNYYACLTKINYILSIHIINNTFFSYFLQLKFTTQNLANAVAKSWWNYLICVCVCAFFMWEEANCTEIVLTRDYSWCFLHLASRPGTFCCSIHISRELIKIFY